MYGFAKNCASNGIQYFEHRFLVWQECDQTRDIKTYYLCVRRRAFKSHSGKTLSREHNPLYR